MAVIGFALAAPGLTLYTQLGRVGLDLINIAALGNAAATIGGFLVALVGSVIWARRTSIRRPITVGALIGIASLLLSLVLKSNIHGPSGILLFVVLFSVVDVATLLVVTYWQLSAARPPGQLIADSVLCYSSVKPVPRTRRPAFRIAWN